MATTTTEQTVNIPENLEEFQLDIINRARELGTQPFQLPGFQVAGMTPVQQLAMQRVWKASARTSLCYRQGQTP